MARPPANDIFAIIEEARPKLVALEAVKLNRDRYAAQAKEYADLAAKEEGKIAKAMESLNVVADDLVALYARYAEEVPPVEAPVEVEGGART